MAKTMEAIEMDFKNAARQADELEQVAQDLSVLADESFQECLSKIAANWKGENATAFCQKGSTVGNHIKNAAEDLKNSAETLRQIARNLYEADKRVYEIARNRDYKGS